MDLEKVNFNKNITYGNEKKFALRFEGIESSSNIDKEKINKLLDNLISSKSHDKKCCIYQNNTKRS